MVASSVGRTIATAVARAVAGIGGGEGGGGGGGGDNAIIGSLSVSSLTPLPGANVVFSVTMESVHGTASVSNATPTTGGSITISWAESLSFQLRKDGGNISSTVATSGDVTTLTLTDISPDDDGVYEVVVTDTRNSTTRTFTAGTVTVATTALLHTVTLNNDSGSTSSGLAKFGLAFEKTDIPSGRIPQLFVDGAAIRSSMLDVATWSDGSLRKCTIACDVGSVASSGSAVIEVRSKVGTQPIGTFNVANFVAGLADDATVSVTSRTGSATGAMGDLSYSLQTAYAVSTRREVTDNTPVLVRAKCWQKVSGEEHLVCLNYLDIWLDAGGSAVAWEWVPVLSQHWWVNDPFGVEQTKERYTYNATVACDGGTVDSRTSLAHAYYCRWASLYSGDDDQHATPHWINISVAKPTLRLEYSVDSRKRMARVGGYMPPLNWTDSGWTVTTTDTYTPLGINGHRAQINNVGAYDGRGQITRMDANAIVLQTAGAWRVMRVGAQAGLAVFNATYDHRVVDTQPSMRLIPLKFTNQGAQSYTGLGAEIHHSKGASFDTGLMELAEDDAVGGTGAFAGYDNDHGVPYSSFAAFVTGEAYLNEAALPQANYTMNYSNMNSFSHNKADEFGYTTTPRRGAIPTTGGVRGRAWSMNMISWCLATCSDNDPHKAYLTKALENYSEFLEASYDLYTADHKTFGGWLWNPPSYYSPWMHAWCAMIFSQWRKLTDDAGIVTGFDHIAEMSVKPLSRAIDIDRLAAIGGFVFRLPVGGGVGTNIDLGWLEGETGIFVLSDADYASGVFTVDPSDYDIQNGDRILLAPYNSSNGTSGLTWPSELDFRTVYYAVDVSGDSFGVSATPGGSAIAITGSGTSSLGIERQAFNEALPPTGFGGDSQVMMVWAAIVAAHLTGQHGVDTDHVAAVKNYISTSSRAAYGPWNYSEVQT